MTKLTMANSRLKLIRMEHNTTQSRGDETYAWRRECEYMHILTRKRHMLVVMEMPTTYHELTWRFEWWMWHKQSRKWICRSGEYCTAERWKVEVTVDSCLKYLEHELCD